MKTTDGPRELAEGRAVPAPPAHYGPRELLREFILPPFNPTAGTCCPLTLGDLAKMLLTLVAGAVGFWALWGHGVLWGAVGAAVAGWLWRPLLLVSVLGVAWVVDGVARVCRAAVGRPAPTSLPRHGGVSGLEASQPRQEN